MDRGIYKEGGETEMQNAFKENLRQRYHPFLIKREAFLSCNVLFSAEVSLPQSFSQPLFKNPFVTREFTNNATIT